MKKSGSKSFEDFPSTTLYLNDLKDIVKVLTENCEKVKLKTGEYDDVMPEEIDELSENIKEERFQDIYLSAYTPYISVELRSYGIRVYISKDDIVERGVVSKIREITHKNVKRHFGKLTNLLTLLPASTLGIALIEGQYVLSAIMLVITLLMISRVVKYQMKNKVIVIPENKKLRASFFKRKKDELIVALVAAFMGALVSFVLIKYFGQA